MFLAFGISALIVALVLAGVLLRLGRALAALEELVVTSTAEIRQVMPEVHQSLGNVNDIAAGVNVALRVAGGGAQDLGDRLKQGIEDATREGRAWTYGAGVAARSVWRSVSAPVRGGTDLTSEGDRDV